MRSFQKLFIVSLILVLVSGCSANRFLYNRLDTFVNWWIDDYVDFSAEQQDDFDADLSVVLQWHRAEELPRYKVLITESLAALDDGVAMPEATKIADDIDDAVSRIQAQFLSVLLAIAESMTDDQINEFLTKVDEDQLEYRDKRLSRSDDTYYRDSAESLEGLAKRLLGRLNKDQREEIAKASMELTRLDGLWHADRAKWGASLRAILEDRSGPWREQIVALVDDRETQRIPKYVAAIDRNGDIILQLLVDVINQRTERQDRHLRSFLGDLIDDIDALSAPIDRD